MENPAAKPILNTTKVACSRLGISMARLYELLAERRIDSVKLGSRRMIPEIALERFAASLADDH